jgi:phage-related protein
MPWTLAGLRPCRVGSNAHCWKRGRIAQELFDKRLIFDTVVSVKGERPLEVVFFKTEGGNEPVREWLKSLPREERYTIGEDLLTVQHAWPVGKPLVDHLGGGIWELRSRLPNRIARTLFIVAESEIVVLNGFIKKTQKTPAHELDLARRRKRQYEQRYE